MSGTTVAVECALRRVRTRLARVLAIAAAIAVGIGGLLLVSVAETIAGDRALQRGIDDVPAELRALTVTSSPDVAPSSDDLGGLNGAIAGHFEHRGLGPTIRTVEYRALAAGDGRTVRFAGLDDLPSVTRLVSGAWPSRCDAQRCDVVAVVGAADAPPVAALPSGSSLGLTLVGTVVTTSPLVLTGQLRPDATEVIILTDGVAPASALPALSLFRRTYAWQAPVESSLLRSSDIDPLLDGVRSLAEDASLPGMQVSGPEDQVRSALSRAHITGNRLAVPVGALLVLFFGVTVVAGLGGRADHQRAVWVLRRRGANGWAIGAFRALEAALPVIAGAVAGAAAALGVGAWLGDRAGLGAANVLGRSLQGTVIERVAAVAVAAFVLIAAVLGIRDVTIALRRRILPSDVAGASALVVLLVLIARGSISAVSLSGDVDPTLVAVPVLAAIALTAIVVRLIPVVLRATSHASPRRWPLTKLTLSEATAQPVRSIATGALIAVTVMFALLTFGYASTLRLGSRDQAAFAVPYDFKLQVGASLVRPQTLTPPGGWSALAPGTTSTDVVRRGVALHSSATRTETVELVGLDVTTLSSLHGWRPGFGPAPTRLARTIDTQPPVSLGAVLPVDATSIEFVGSGFDGLHVSAVIQRLDGTWHEVTLEQPTTGGVTTALTPGDAGGELIGLRLAQPADVSARVEHHIGEGNTSAAAQAVDVVLQSVRTSAADGRQEPVSLQLDRLRADNAVVRVEGSSLRISGSLLGVAILVTPSDATEAQPLDAVVDPATARAAHDGVVVMETSSGQLRLHPSAVVARFPGAGPRFAIVDIDALQPALDLLQPGAGTANELWLGAPDASHERALAAALGTSAFADVDVDRRSSREAALSSDPLSVVTLLVLAVSALVGAVLGAFAVLFGAAADATDDRPLLRTLAMERVNGRRLVAMAAGKSLAVVVLAIPLGLVGGRWLLQIATRLVAVSATSARPDPALRLSVPWALVAPLTVGLFAVLIGGALAGAVSARHVPDEDLMRGTT